MKRMQLQLRVFSLLQAPFKTTYIKFAKENYFSHYCLSPLFIFNLASLPLQSLPLLPKRTHTFSLSLSLSYQVGLEWL